MVRNGDSRERDKNMITKVETLTHRDLGRFEKRFWAAYVEAALFCGVDDIDGNDCQPDPSDIGLLTLAEMDKDCDEFLTKANHLITDEMDYEQVARDFWFTRNGHGCGFWDGNYPEPAATQLTDIAKSFGPYTLYRGDNSLVCGFNG